jgi:hypothetical protein
MKYILFTDFDGVVHPGTRGTFVLMPLLEQWLTENAHVEVVISYSWRLENSLKELRACFGNSALHSRIISSTPDLRPIPTYPRQAEVEAWVQSNCTGPVRIAALDDDASLFRPGCPWLIHTQSKVGVTPFDFLRLASLLKQVPSLH